MIVVPQYLRKKNCDDCIKTAGHEIELNESSSMVMDDSGATKLNQQDRGKECLNRALYFKITRIGGMVEDVIINPYLNP